MGRPKKSDSTPTTPMVREIDDEDMQHAVELAADTLTGDIRDFILDRLRYEQDKRPWNARGEDEQRRTVQVVEEAVRKHVTAAIEIIAAGGRRTVSAVLSQVLVKDGLKGVIELSRFDDRRHQLIDSVGSRVLIVVADPTDYEGERAPVEIKPDQGDLVAEAMAVHSTADGTADLTFH
jgi:hypothetical protein